MAMGHRSMNLRQHNGFFLPGRPLAFRNLLALITSLENEVGDWLLCHNQRAHLLALPAGMIVE